MAHLLSPASATAIRTAVGRLGAWGPLLVIGLMVLHSATFIPAEVLTIASILAFGPVWGVVYSWIGAMLGAYVAFYVARALGRPLVERHVPPKHLQRFDGAVGQYGVRGLLVMRLIPLISFNALNYASGLAEITWWEFTWTTGLGILPAEIAIAFAVHSAQDLGTALWVVGGLGTLVLLAFVWRAWRQRRTPGD